MAVSAIDQSVHLTRESQRGCRRNPKLKKWEEEEEEKEED